jgi:hypothetical protein
MRWSRTSLFLAVVLGIIGVNYLAQIPYYIHLYYPHPPSLIFALLLGATFVWFLAGYLLLARGSTLGYWLLLSYLLAMVGFYLHNVLIQTLNGFNPLFFLRDHDPLVGVVLAIGHLNMLAGAYFIYFLLRHRRTLISDGPQAASPGPQAA